MKVLPRSLTARLIATAVALVALVSLLVAVASTVAINSYLTARLDGQVKDALARAVHPPPDRDGRGDGADHDGDATAAFGQGPGTLVVRFTGSDSAGIVLTRSADRRPLAGPSLRKLAKVPLGADARSVNLTVGKYRVMATRDTAGDRLVVGLPSKDISSTTGSLLAWSLLLAACGVALAALAGIWLVRRQLRPLREVAAAAHEVTRQPLSSGETTIDTRVAAEYTDPDTEVGAVGSALNTLLDHVDSALASRHRSEQQVRQFVADASHELRTPLSTIHGYAELSRRHPEDPAALSLALGKVETEANRMSTLVEDLLLLARLDSGRPLARDEVDVTRLLLEAVADARVVAPGHRWRLQLPEEPVTVTGDEQRLHQVVTNLLGNAQRHTPAGTTVTVSAVGGSGAAVVRLVVHDDGPGLPADLCAHAFERFTRGDSSRTRASGGVGLGLSLVAAIAEAHGGSAAVESKPGSTTFTVILPADLDPSRPRG